MKRKTKIVLFSFLTINFIVQIIYQFVIRPKIPYDWWYMSDTNYPLDIADHFTDCFFGLNYFLVGYLFFAEKYYCDSMVATGIGIICRRVACTSLLCFLHVRYQ